MDSYNKLNGIAFKLMKEMTEPKKDQEIIVEEDTSQVEESSTPKKVKMKVIKEMGGVLKVGESVDVVKKGSSYEVYKEVHGAQPVKLNQKQAEEFFGSKLNEALGEKIGAGLRKAGQAVSGFAKDVVSGATNTSATEREVLGLAKTMNVFLKAQGVDQFTDQQVQHFLNDKVLRPIIAKYADVGGGEPSIAQQTQAAKSAAAPAAAAPKVATGPATKTISQMSSSGDIKKIPIKDLRAELDRRSKEDEAKRAEDEAAKTKKEEKEEMDEDAKAKLPKGVPQAKFVDKNAAKPKKAKEIGAFRGGKAGTGTKAPKE